MLRRAVKAAVEREAGPEVPAHLRAHRGTANFEPLRGIFDELKAHRGFDDFVRAGGLSRFDYYVPSAGLVVQFDESPDLLT